MSNGSSCCSGGLLISPIDIRDLDQLMQTLMADQAAGDWPMASVTDDFSA
ncbi:hypothetical protein [Synechococcus sp. J7-Johnson]|nr:hypothetical protein [Synechococcus sp. J7-Johnson]